MFMNAIMDFSNNFKTTSLQLVNIVVYRQGNMFSDFVQAVVKNSEDKKYPGSTLRYAVKGACTNKLYVVKSLMEVKLLIIYI